LGVLDLPSRTTAEEKRTAKAGQQTAINHGKMKTLRPRGGALNAMIAVSDRKIAKAE